MLSQGIDDVQRIASQLIRHPNNGKKYDNLELRLLIIHILIILLKESLNQLPILKLYGFNQVN